MVKFTASMEVNSMIECNEFNFNCKTAAILAPDAECIYPFKPLFSFSVTCLTTMSGAIVAPTPIVRMQIQLPKIGHNGRDAKHSLKWAGMSKRRKDHKKWGCGKCLKWKKLLCESKSKKIH